MKTSMISKMKKQLETFYRGTLDKKWESGFRKPVIYFYRYSIHLGREFINDHCFLRASALTFTSLLTLIPILVLIFVIFRAFGGLEIIQQRVEMFLFSHLLPDSVASIRSYIQGFVTGFNSKTVSSISVLFLVVSAYGLFASIDSSLNSVWKVADRRSFISRLVNLWFILTISPLLLGYSLYLSTQLLEYRGMQLQAIIVVIKVVLWAAPTILTWITLILLFKYVPRARVNWSSAVFGAGIAAILWEFSKYGFNVYVQNVVNIKMLYGSFMLLPLFLVWIHLTWLIVLVGAELTYIHQHYSSLHFTFKNKGTPRDNALLDTVALAIMTWIGRAFVSGNKPITQKELKEKTHLGHAELNLYLDKLQSAELIMISQEKGTSTIARDSAKISVNEIMDLFLDSHDKRAVLNPNKSFYQDLSKKRREWIKNMTLNELIKEEKLSDRHQIQGECGHNDIGD